ncbi:RNA polymerase II-associated factor 1 homolog [Ptychodera flava]|uniref:RNA polymerase II-associated factor 1 homolog n=1 Tax=Ptychodera flava TaxID=63121 RepID=UPI00396A8E4A
MPPTIQSGDRSDRERKSRSTGPGRSDLVCRVKYCNNLPDIPFDPKFITYPFEPNRFVQYNATSLERAYKHELLTEHDLGVTIDLINPDTYKIDPNAVLDPADEKLLEEEISTPGDSKRSRRHAKSVSWLRKTEYISTEYNRFTHSSEKAETKVGASLRKQFADEDLYKDRDSQIAAIEKTFEMAKQPILQHYSKPHVTPVETYPVCPDFDLWIHPCAQVIFDSDPAVKDKPVVHQVEEMSQAMIRGMVDESGEQFVGYFLPTEETKKKRKRDFEEDTDYVPEEEYEYKMVREYNWNVKNKATKGYEENYFFVLRPEGFYYNELETRVRLSKRRAKGGMVAGNSQLVVKHRDLMEQERAQQEGRLMQLEPAMQEEEDAEIEEEEEEMEAEGEGEVEVEEEEEREVDEDEESKEIASEAEESGSEKEASEGEEQNESGQEVNEEAASENEEESGSEKGEESGSSSSSSESESEEEERRNEEEIFGSASESEEDEGEAKSDSEDSD